MPDLQNIFDRHGKYQDAMVSAFESHLRDLIRRAQARTIAQLQRKLSITDGVIDNTSANMAVLRTVDTVFVKEMKDAGYPRLVRAFIGEFRGTLPFLNDVIENLGKEVGQDWRVNLRPSDQSILAGIQANIADSLTNAVANVATAAMTRGMFGIGGLEFGDLVQTLSDKLETSISTARTIADTGMSTFYRTATDRAFQVIEKEQPKELEIKYRYSGPDDKLTRPFCRHLLAVDKAYTRDRIGEMSNGQLPNVFLTGGGWNCRHQWILDTEGLRARLASAA